MYPETDLVLLKIDRERINKLKKKLPRLREDIRAELKKKGLTDELINLIISDENDLDEFNVLMKVYDKDSNLVAKMITLWRSEFAKKLSKTSDEIREVLSEEMLEEVLIKVKNKQLDKRDVKPTLLKILEGISFSEAIKIEKVSDDEVEEEVRKIVKEKPGLRVNAYMGIVMEKFKGKLDARKAAEIVKKIVED